MNNGISSSINRQRTTRLIAAVVLLFMVVTCGSYIYTYYTPVPIRDMWDGNLGFLLEFTEGKHSALFSQHNEHRIVLTKILFLLDYYVFGDRYISLYFFNFLCPFLLIFLLYINLREQINYKEIATFWILVCIPAFSLEQQENFAWAFQSQFFLANILPLAVYYFAVRYKLNGQPINLLYMSAFAMLCAGTMANGSMALVPVILLFLFYKFEWKSAAMVIGVFAIIVFLYFNNFHQNPNHSDIKTGLLQHPVQLVKHTLTMMGSPFREALLAQIVGAIYTGILFYIAFKIVFKKVPLAQSHAILLFALYLGLSAFLVATGRYNFGILSAFAGRYQTPSMYLLMAVFILLFLDQNKYRKWTSGVLGFLCVLLIFTQLQKIDVGKEEKRFMQWAGFVSAAQGNFDLDTFKNNVYPFGTWKGIFDRSQADGIALPATPEIKVMNNYADRKDENVPMERCLGHLDKIVFLEDTSVYRLEGWLADPSVTLKKGRYAYLTLSQNNDILGFGVLGKTREDVKKHFDNKDFLRTGYWVYLKNIDQVSDLTNAKIYLSSEDRSCSLGITPEMLGKLSP